MSNTYSSLLRIVGTSLKAASIHVDHCVCTVRPTNSTLHNLIGTTVVATSLPLGAMRNTNSSLNDTICTTFEVASLHLRAMRDTNSSFDGTIVTSFKTASQNCIVYASASLLHHA
jgi:hypothetical protein